MNKLDLGCLSETVSSEGDEEEDDILKRTYKIKKWKLLNNLAKGKVLPLEGEEEIVRRAGKGGEEAVIEKAQ